MDKTERRDAANRMVLFLEGQRVFKVGHPVQGTITAIFTDLIMVQWDDRTHDSADPMAYDQIVPIPRGWDSV